MANPQLIATLESAPVASFVLDSGRGSRALAALGITAPALLAVARDEDCSITARFAAFERWIAMSGEAELRNLDRETLGALAEVQTAAMRSSTEPGLWGLPPEVTNSPVSRHLIVAGDAALPYLRPLLNEIGELEYEGSETSAVAAIRAYRLCDLGAALAGVIVGVPYRDAAKPAERDAQIEEVRRAIDQRLARQP